MVEERMNKADAFMYLVAVATSVRDNLRREKTDLDLADGIRQALEELGFTVEDGRKSSRYFFNGKDIFRKGEIK
jgi:cysteinyl-tRNA synthetase